jgi:hypothetical protein
MILANPTFDHNLPGALFSNAAAYLEFHTERRAYEAAVQTFATEASPAVLRKRVALARDHGFRLTMAEAREAAVCGLRESLLALGYGEDDVRWHAANPGRRITEGFVTLRRRRGPEPGKWRGYYSNRKSGH